MTIARFGHVESIDSTKPEDVQTFFEQVVSQKCEGLMVKLLESGEGLAGEDAEDDENETGDAEPEEKTKGKAAGRKKPLPSTYEPDARSQGWLKVKKDYLEGVGDSLDLIPIGAWYGMGRKAGWWSPILLAVYNPETGALEAVCKCLAGKWIRESRSEHLPDVFFFCCRIHRCVLQSPTREISPNREAGDVTQRRTLCLLRDWRIKT